MRVRGGSRGFYSPKKNLRAAAQMRSFFQEVLEEKPELNTMLPYSGPIVLFCIHCFSKPKNYYEGKDFTKRPDLDNLNKMILDGFQGLIWEDDKYIVATYSAKKYSNKEGTAMKIKFYEETRRSYGKK